MCGAACTVWVRRTFVFVDCHRAADRSNFTQTAILKRHVGIVVSVSGASPLFVSLTQTTSTTFCILIIKWFLSSVFWALKSEDDLSVLAGVFFCLFINWGVYRAHSFGTAVCICLLVIPLFFFFFLTEEIVFILQEEKVTGSTFPWDMSRMEWGRLHQTSLIEKIL